MLSETWVRRAYHLESFDGAEHGGSVDPGHGDSESEEVVDVAFVEGVVGEFEREGGDDDEDVCEEEEGVGEEEDDVGEGEERHLAFARPGASVAVPAFVALEVFGVLPAGDPAHHDEFLFLEAVELGEVHDEADDEVVGVEVAEQREVVQEVGLLREPGAPSAGPAPLRRQFCSR